MNNLLIHKVRQKNKSRFALDFAIATERPLELGDCSMDQKLADVWQFRVQGGDQSSEHMGESWGSLLRFK